MQLHGLKVVGFFSLPPASLAEYNPDAYNNAMAGAPADAGTCAHCGTGILHHVVCETPEGQRVFIGSQCAERIGGEVGECSKDRLTADQLVARNAKRDAERAEWQRQNDERNAKRAAQADINAPLIAELRSAYPGGFVLSIIADLEQGANPAEFTDRTKAILRDIIGKIAGRGNSKAYWANVDRFAPFFDGQPA